MKRFLMGLILSLAIMMTGCAYVNVKTPLDTDMDQTSLGTKTGEASLQSVLWLVAWGDAGTKKAAENGEITVIRHADQKTYSILFGLYSKVTTIVYGD
ncbi:MAG: TRL-like family protein [Proteobacteria bacterium]|nr:TRL-like family protein [Pseudomonadota bacterium]